jgi:hypothetical protein
MKLSMTDASILSGIAWTSSRILVLRVSKSGIRVAKTRLLRYPQRKKLQAVRSGDLAGHGMSPKREMILPANTPRNVVNVSRAVCAVAPSCWK